jgi:hypothetical protein
MMNRLEVAGRSDFCGYDTYYMLIRCGKQTEPLRETVVYVMKTRLKAFYLLLQ